MRYTELIAENDDNDMFGNSERVGRDIRRATFTANIPEMIRRVQQGLLANADRLARAMATEFFREANFLEKEEVYELAREVFTHEAPQHLHQAFAILSEDPAIIEDEDRMSDVLMTNNIFTDIRNDCELWIYTSEMLEEFAEGDENQGDLEYHLAMEIEGTVGNLMVSLIQQAFADVRALGENSKPGVAEDTDDDLFSNRPNGKVIAQDLELWLRRRQSGSRRSIGANSVQYVQRIIAGFNQSFASGVAVWRSGASGTDDSDIKWNIREYLENSMNIDISQEALGEAPLADYQPLGDFNKPGPFRGADKRLVPHPTNQLKTAQFFEQTPYDFRLFFSNISGTGKYSEYGAMDPETVKIIFGDSDAGEQIVQGHENAITVVFVGNKGDSKVMLTPWMMAHRIGHAIQATGRMRQSEGPWKAAEDHFFRAINSLLDEFYGRRGNPGGQLKNELRGEYNALFNAIGTQRSSRTGQITRPYEFLYELFAQYLGTGQVTLNPLPKQQDYGRKAWGSSTKSLRLRGDEEETKYTTEVLARDMELMFDDVLSSMVGKILVM